MTSAIRVLMPDHWNHAVVVTGGIPPGVAMLLRLNMPRVLVAGSRDKTDDPAAHKAVPNLCTQEDGNDEFEQR